MSTTTLDLSARYRVDGYGGVAFYLLGWAQDEMAPEPWLEHLDDDCEHEEPGCWVYPEEPEYVDSTTMVRAVMVGDDREHIIPVDDLTVIEDEDYCHECGQIGCTADGR